jgi:glycosyltransferase involved in cell wall biosynthesis
MTGVCIHTLEPLQHGGVMAKVRVVGEILRASGHNPHLMYTATDQVPSGNWMTKIKYLLTHATPSTTQFEDYQGIAFPYWPLPIWATYFCPWLWMNDPRYKFPIQVVVSGAAQCGFPVALTRQRYIVWMSTMYEDELAGRALAGDAWAAKTGTGISARLLQYEEKLVIENATMVIANGEYIAKKIVDKFPAVAGKIRTIVYPVDTDLFRPGCTTQEHNSDSYLLFTGRINDPRKNISMLFRAFARVLAELPDVRLVLTGDDPNDYLLESASEAGVLSKVDFVGRQTEQQLISLYQGAEVFVLSSNQEGLGISILEAMACGVPVVATNCGGPDNIVVDGKTGFLVDLNDDYHMANNITRLLKDPQLREKFSNDSVRVANESFSREVMTKSLLKAFHDVYPEYFSI